MRNGHYGVAEIGSLDPVALATAGDCGLYARGSGADRASAAGEKLIPEYSVDVRGSGMMRSGSEAEIVR